MNKQNKILKTLFGLGILACVLAGFFSLYSRQTVIPSQTDINLSEAELARLVKPAVVRIAQHAQGHYALPRFSLDLQNMQMQLDGMGPTTSLDEYITGTGFAVNPDGYFLTNAHVVSKQSIQSFILEDALHSAFEQALRDTDPQTAQQIMANPEQLDKFAQQALKDLFLQSRFDLTSELVVLNPASDKENITDLMRLGFEAKPIYVNEEFLFDEKDVALIKIEQSGIPAMELGQDGQGQVGQRVFVLGYPATAEFNRRSPLESSFTEGVLSADKFSDAKDFKVFQTNAKISQGSSGGPLFNSQGQAIGIITFETSPVKREAGDNFAFAVPISLAKDILRQKDVENVTGSYRQNILEGLKQSQLGSCRKANEYFNLARKSNFYFLPEKQLDPLIQNCQEQISRGNSIDTKWQELKEGVKTFPPVAWFTLAVGLALLLFGLLGFYGLLWRLKKDEREIEELKWEAHMEKETPSALETPLPLPDEEIHSEKRRSLGIAHPHLSEYVKKSREAGTRDAHITKQLKKAGWDPEEIKRAL